MLSLRMHTPRPGTNEPLEPRAPQSLPGWLEDADKQGPLSIFGVGRCRPFHCKVAAATRRAAPCTAPIFCRVEQQTWRQQPYLLGADRQPPTAIRLHPALLLGMPLRQFSLALYCGTSASWPSRCSVPSLGQYICCTGSRCVTGRVDAGASRGCHPST